MDCFTFEQPELSVGEISRKTGLHKSTVHRILMALEYNRLIQQRPESGKYQLGIKLFELGNQAVSCLNLREIAKFYLIRLMEETQETVHLAVLEGNEVLYVEKVEGPHALRMPSRIGRRIPTYCTSLGKAMLSCLEEREVRRILQSRPFQSYTPNTITGMNKLLTDLEVTRKRGYAVDNEEIELGLRCVGAPIRDYTGQMVGAISVAGPSARLSQEKLPSLGDLVVKVAASISQELGHNWGERFAQKDRGKEHRVGQAK